MIRPGDDGEDVTERARRKSGHPGVSGEAPGGGADAAAGKVLASAGGAAARAAPGVHGPVRSRAVDVAGARMGELISALTEEEYVTVLRVVLKLHKEGSGGDRRVFAYLRALAGCDRCVRL